MSVGGRQLAPDTRRPFGNIRRGRQHTGAPADAIHIGRRSRGRRWGTKSPTSPPAQYKRWNISEQKKWYQLPPGAERSRLRDLEEEELRQKHLAQRREKAHGLLTDEQAEIQSKVVDAARTAGKEHDFATIRLAETMMTKLLIGGIPLSLGYEFDNPDTSTT